MTRSWKEGDALAPIERTVTREQLRDYAEASGDKNPIHLDDSFAREAGLPGVVVHGMLSMSFLADLVQRNFPSDRFRLTKIKSRFRKLTLPDQKLICEGTVREAREDGGLLVTVAVVNPQGEVTTDAVAEITEL